MGVTGMNVEPGLYYLCWCRGECARVEDFSMEVGPLYVAQPIPGQTRYCEVGQRCLVTGVDGIVLRPDDKIMARRSTITSADVLYDYLCEVEPTYRNEEIGTTLIDKGFSDVDAA